MDTIENETKTTAKTTRLAAQLPTPQHGDHAGDLIYDTAADPTRGGIWIYPASYDDVYLCRRRARSLADGFGLSFSVDLFGASGADGEVTPSIAVAEPGYCAFTTADPRPKVVYITPRRCTLSAPSILKEHRR